MKDALYPGNELVALRQGKELLLAQYLKACQTGFV
jgi:hypothetical protein